METWTPETFIETGSFSLPVGKEHKQTQSSSPETTPVSFIGQLSCLIQSKGETAEQWHSELDRLRSYFQGKLVFSTFRRNNGFDFTDFEKYFAISGGTPQLLENSLTLNALSKQNTSAVFNSLPSGNSWVCHALLRFPSNIENNFYIHFEGEDSESMRIGNSQVTACSSDSTFELNTKLSNLYTFAISKSHISIYVNGILRKRKRRTGTVSFRSFSFRIAEHASADISGTIEGVELCALEKPFTGFSSNTDEISLRRLETLIEEGNLQAAHEWIESIDDLDISRLFDPLCNLVDRHLDGESIQEWIYEDLLDRLPEEKATYWSNKWQKKLPRPAISVDNLRVEFYKYPNKRLSLRNLLFRNDIERFDVLSNINFKTFPGDILGIVGANGAGKSTLLRAISGLIPIKEGKIVLQGNHLLLSPGLGIRQELSGRDNIYLACCFMGLTMKQAQEIYPSIVDFSELADSIDQPFKYYSDGMKSRLIFSIATAVAPDILMLDELLNAGDVKFQRKASQRMDELIGRIKVVIVVTHSVPFVLEKCTKAILITKGRQICYGSPRMVVSRYLNELHLGNSFSGMDREAEQMTTMQHLQTQSFLPSTMGAH